MADSEIPSISVVATPQFDSDGRALSLRIALSAGFPQVEAGSRLISFPKYPKYAAIDTVEASDGLGQLPLRFDDSDADAGLQWLAGRQTSGPVTFQYKALPVHATKIHFVRSTIDLRYDQGGLLGSGWSFIPVPQIIQPCRNRVEWDLSKAPAGTRAVWTYGEGPQAVEKTGPVTILSDSVYMVGPIHSNPPAPAHNSFSDYYGYYWFGDLPPNIEVIRDIHHPFFLKLSNFFEDPPSSNNSYRSFIRSTAPAKGFGNTGFTRSNIFDYDDQIHQAQDYDLVRRMAQEMVHNWLGPPATADSIDWLYEGIASCLSIMLPFRPPNQFRTGHYFQMTICMLLLRYYTNPLLHVPHDEILRRATTDAYAKDMHIARAWAFVMGVDLRARRITHPELKRPVEDFAIKPLAKRRAMSEPHGVQEFLKLLEPVMGNEAKEHYEQMRRGEVIVLPVNVYGAKTHHLIPLKQEILDFGMERESFEECVVRGLKAGSRAEKAGLKNGDKIVTSSHLWRCIDDFETEMEVTVSRDGVETRIKYWPRSFEKADSWKMVKVEDG